MATLPDGFVDPYSMSNSERLSFYESFRRAPRSIAVQLVGDDPQAVLSARRLATLALCLAMAKQCEDADDKFGVQVHKVGVDRCLRQLPEYVLAGLTPI